MLADDADARDGWVCRLPHDSAARVSISRIKSFFIFYLPGTDPSRSRADLVTPGPGSELRGINCRAQSIFTWTTIADPEGQPRPTKEPKEQRRRPGAGGVLRSDPDWSPQKRAAVPIGLRCCPLLVSWIIGTKHQFGPRWIS